MNVDRVVALVQARGALLFSVAMLALFAYAAYEINTSFTTRARLFANAVIVPSLVLGILQVLRETRRTRAIPCPPEAAFTRAAVIWAGAFLVTMWAIGLELTIPLFAVVYLRYCAGEPLRMAAAYALVAWLFVEVLFDRLLHVPLPTGAMPLPIITP